MSERQSIVLPVDGVIGWFGFRFSGFLQTSDLGLRTSPMIPRRYLLVTCTFLLSVLLYVDRTCISTAKDAVCADLGLSKEQWSWVLASFAFGYALFQTPGGAMADRFGGRFVLTAVVTAWSIFTGLTAAAWNLASMLVIRFLFGAGEAGAFPAWRGWFTLGFRCRNGDWSKGLISPAHASVRRWPCRALPGSSTASAGNGRSSF